MNQTIDEIEVSSDSGSSTMKDAIVRTVSKQRLPSSRTNKQASKVQLGSQDSLAGCSFSQRAQQNSNRKVGGKKRTLQEVTQGEEEHLGGHANRFDDSREGREQRALANQLWPEKYAPRQLSELVVQKKKIGEFIEFAEQGAQVMVMQGPPGCGKNALLKAYAEQEHKTLTYFKDINTNQQQLEEIYGSSLRQWNGPRAYPDDLENLLFFIRMNCYPLGTKSQRVVSGRSDVKLGVSSFCKSKKPQSTFAPNSQTRESSKEQANGSIFVVQGLPECLTMVTSMRHQLLKDFNHALDQILVPVTDQKHRLPLLVFMLNDPAQRTRSFLNKVFFSKVLSHPSVCQLNLNPPTDAQIDKILKQVTANEGIASSVISDQQLVEIRTQSNKDLRNALMTLQFRSAGKLSAQVDQFGSGNSGSGKRRKLTKTNDGEEDQSDTSMDSHGRQKKKTSAGGQVTGKESSLSIFHALGKFLYNKRINPRNPLSLPAQMPFKDMKSVLNRPKLYYKPDAVLAQSLLEPSVFQLYLHENMPSFFGDIEDLADSLDTFSEQDSCTSQLTYSFANQKEIVEMNELSALVTCYAVTETNLHCLQAKDNNPNGRHMLKTLQAPYFFEHKRTYKQNHLALRDLVKEDQMVRGQLLSEDMLIRSLKDTQTHLLPFLVMLGLCQSELTTLKHSSRYRASESGGGRTLGQEDAVAENYAKESILDDHLMRKRQQARKETITNKSLTFERTNQIDTASLLAPRKVSPVAKNNPEQEQTVGATVAKDIDDIDENDIMDAMDLDESALGELMEDLSIEEDISSDSD